MNDVKKTFKIDYENKVFCDLQLNRIIIFLLGLLLLFNVFSSCNLKKEEFIEFDNSHPLALAPDISWAVVTEPYVAYKVNIGWDSNAEGHCRKGDILQVYGRSLDNNKEIWFLFENGWLPATSLTVFDNRYKAESFAKKIE